MAMMVIAGPLFNIPLVAVFYMIGQIIPNAGLSEAVYWVIKYLAGLNAIPAVFNLVHAFPPDSACFSFLWEFSSLLVIISSAECGDFF